MADIRRTPRGKRPPYFADPATDKLLAMVIALAEELSVTRDRLDTMEQLLTSRSLLPIDAMETFQPSDGLEQLREQRRERFVARLLHALQAELDEAIGAPAEQA